MVSIPNYEYNTFKNVSINTENSINSYTETLRTLPSFNI